MVADLNVYLMKVRLAWTKLATIKLFEKVFVCLQVFDPQSQN